jgi:hypothetical protein
MLMLPKSAQIQIIISRVKEELRKALFSVFDATSAGLSHDKISTLQNL